MEARIIDEGHLLPNSQDKFPGLYSDAGTGTIWLASDCSTGLCIVPGDGERVGEEYDGAYLFDEVGRFDRLTQKLIVEFSQ